VPTLDRESLVAALTAFAHTPKFRCQEPPFRHLNPSPHTVTAPLETALNQCAVELRGLVQSGGDPRAFRRCLSNSLRAVDKPFDTEDREYLLYYYEQLADLVGIRIGGLLNRWLYGLPLALLLSLFSRR
jgi:Domain of unknown function (DUF4844)